MQTADLQDLVARMEAIYHGVSCLVSRLERIAPAEEPSDESDAAQTAELAAITSKLMQFSQSLSVQTLKMINAAETNVAAARKMVEAATINDAASKRMLEAARLMNTASARQGTRRS